MAKARKPDDSDPPLDVTALRTLIQRALDGQGKKQRVDEERAQDLLYDAMDARTPKRRLSLARKALELDSGNADALLMIADAAGFEGEERISVLRCITGVAAKRLGARAFKELAPHFWGFIETRPYMRARERLAEALRTAGRLEEAVREFSEMLALNENDNQGVRYLLFASLLALHQLGEARTLMERFKDEWDCSVVFAWGRVLERLLSGDEPGAAKALRLARKQNPHVETYLNGHRKLPKDLPGSYSHGSVEEALCYAEPLLMAWRRYPAAQAWLLAQRKPAGKPQQVSREGTEGLQAPGLN